MEVMKKSKKKLTFLGQLLVEKARELGLSEREFAEKVLKITANYFYLLKYGEKGQKAPRAETIRKIAKVLEIPPKKVWEIIESNKKENYFSEPFPGFNEIMELPIRERYEAVWRLAGKKYGIEALHAIGDPLHRSEVPLLETEEQIIEEYKKADAFFKRISEKMKKEFEEIKKPEKKKPKTKGFKPRM